MVMNKQTRAIGLLLGLAGAVYLLNIGFGVVEFIPDNLPLWGNLDEGAATLLMLNGLRILGVNIQALFPGGK